MLLLATLGWGLSFTWAKSAQEQMNRQLGVALESAVGPVLTLGARYTLAGMLLLALVSRTRRGWSGASVGRALALGLLLGGALGMQHLGLARTSEAVSAFLTGLTVVIVPLIMAFAFRKSPRRGFWGAAILAAVGVWLMTGATVADIGLGEVLGLGCAVIFSIYLIAINALMPRDDPWRMVCGQFLVVGLLMLLVSWWISREQVAVTSGVVSAIFQHRAIWRDLLLLLLFSTLLPFLLVSMYQPRVDPTRAALIYLLEPIVAAAYAYVVKDHALGARELVGILLIMIANVFVELWRAA